MKYRLLAIAILVSACAPKKSLKQLDEGSFSAPPETINIRIKGYQSQPGKTYKDLFVANFSTKARHGSLHWSTARDGLSDSLKLELAPNYGFTANGPESVVVGFADLLLYHAGLALNQQPYLYCSSNQMINSSNDAFVYNDVRMIGNPQQFLGLRDCEKNYMGLDTDKFDSDGDGIPDYLELRCGMNPDNPHDAYLSTAADGVTNIDKCKRNIPIDESSFTQPNRLFAYTYTTELQTDGSRDFIIRNIPVLNGGQENFIAFYMTEVGLNGSSPSLYTAFMILQKNYAGKTIEMEYWAKTSATFFNQEIVAQ